MDKKPQTHAGFWGKLKEPANIFTVLAVLNFLSVISNVIARLFVSWNPYWVTLILAPLDLAGAMYCMVAGVRSGKNMGLYTLALCLWAVVLLYDVAPILNNIGEGLDWWLPRSIFAIYVTRFMSALAFQVGAFALRREQSTKVP